MTLGMTPEPDFFSLHARKKKIIDVDMLDYGFIERCSDLDELKGILSTLRTGKEGRYPDLEKATENRILAVLPERERNKILRMRSGPSSYEKSTEIDELATWSASMELKNEALKRQEPIQRDLPPVRGQQATKSKLVRAPAKSVMVKKSEQNELKAIPAYDFRSWEKYDVEKALKEIDEDGERAREQAREQRKNDEKRAALRKQELESLNKSMNLEKLKPDSRKLYAGYEKQKGNDCFKANELDMALLYYTRSMAYDDTDAIVYANRALVHLRMKNLAAAEEDSTRAIVLDPAYMKGWSRRGMARYRRGKYAESVQDFEKARRLEPTNREVVKLMKAAQTKHEEVNGTLSGNQTLPVKHDVAIECGEEPVQRFEIIEEESKEQQSNYRAHDKWIENNSSPEKSFTRFEIIEEDGSDDEDEE